MTTRAYRPRPRHNGRVAHASGESATRGGDSSSLIERFEPSAARWVGVFGIAVIVVLVVLLAADGLTAGLAATVAGLLLFALAMWVAMVRPTLHAYTDHLLVRNLVSDVRVPWHLIKGAEVRQTLRVYTRDRVVYAVAVGRTVRQQMRASRSGGAVGQSFGMGRLQPTLAGAEHHVAYQDFVANRILLLAGMQRDASRSLTGVVQRWAYVEITALVAVGVAFVVLVVVASR